MPASEQVYRLSSAYATFGKVFAYSTTSGTLTTPPMLTPQWHTNTPTLGPSFMKSPHANYGLHVL